MLKVLYALEVDSGDYTLFRIGYQHPSVSGRSIPRINGDIINISVRSHPEIPDRENTVYLMGNSPGVTGWTNNDLLADNVTSAYGYIPTDIIRLKQAADTIDKYNDENSTETQHTVGSISQIMRQCDMESMESYF